MRGDPVPVGIGDFVVDPGERASRRPVDQGPGFPAEPEPLVFTLIGRGWLRPLTTGNGNTPIRGAIGVRFVFPGRSPDQITR
jgi:hypothetical protein